VILIAVGFCEVELYVFGPFQLQLVAPVAAPVKDSVEPMQTGLGVAEADTAVGVVPNVTFAVTPLDVPQPLVAVSV
jgi:hypothetical protein